MGFYLPLSPQARQAGDPPGDPMNMSSPLFKNLQTTMDALGYDDTLSWSTQTASTPGTNLAHYPRLMYYYHASTSLSAGPDYLGHVEYITDLDGVPYQYFWYSPWGETLIEEKATRPGMHFDSPYRFNAKELDEEPTNGSSRTPLKINYACEQTGLYYYGARYYNPMVSVWLGVDPLAGEYPSTSGYLYVENNPIMFFDPNGLWKAEVSDDGSVNYQPEVGDNAETLASQYGLTMDQANAILCSGGVGTISGQDVKNVLGTDLLSLDLKSEKATNQRILDHFLFARDYSVTEGKDAFVPAKFYKNVGLRSSSTGLGMVEYGGEKTKVFFQIPFHRSHWENKTCADYWAVSTFGNECSAAGDFTTHFETSNQLKIPLRHGCSFNSFNDSAIWTVDRKKSGVLLDRYNRDLPITRAPIPIKP
jgi:RHS repeat-associated protein